MVIIKSNTDYPGYLNQNRIKVSGGILSQVILQIYLIGIKASSLTVKKRKVMEEIIDIINVNSLSVISKLNNDLVTKPEAIHFPEALTFIKYIFQSGLFGFKKQINSWKFN